MSDKLVQLYQKMADLTAPECAGVGEGSCKVPHSCCDKMACDITRDYAKRVYGITLEEHSPFNYKGAYFLTDKGCTVAPHLRPLCTLHTCSINGLGFKHSDGKIDKLWTNRYFRLRNKIEELECKEHPL